MRVALEDKHVGGGGRSGTTRATSGFSLIEMAVALFVLALLIGSILVPISTQVESRKYNETQIVLEQAREALIGYAAATGRLPCPATQATNGREAFLSPPVGNTSNGLCDSAVTGTAGTNVYVGFLPAVTLGFTPIDSSGLALDAWGLAQNRVRYAVSFQTVNGVFRPFTTLPTSTAGMRAAGMANITGQSLLNVCSAAPVPASPTACSPASTTLASNAVAVIWSLGPNAATTGGTSTDEALNAQAFTSADRVFVSKVKSGGPGAANEFDDVVTWISPPILFNRMIAAGQLP